MMKFIKVLEGEINADSAAKSGKLIKIPGDIPVIKGTWPVNSGPIVNGWCVHEGGAGVFGRGRAGEGPPQ